MKLPRRQFLHLAAGAAALPAVSWIARAQTYPMRSVRIIVGFVAGGPTDVAARVIGQWLSDQFGQPFVIENKPGAGSNIATETVVRSPADGYTLLLGGIPNAINANLFNNLNFDFIRDIAPVASVSRDALVLVAHPSLPTRTVPELIIYAKANPDKINMGSGGAGSPAHLAGELFKMMTGTKMVHVPFRGAGQGIAALLGGQVQVNFASTAVSVEHVKAGKLRALAVTTTSRLEALPDVPTVGEFIPGFEVSGWQGIGAPKATPDEIIDKLNKEINAGLADAKIKARLADLGLAPLAGSPADFEKLIADETEKWGKVIRAANIKPE
jgi:tripartite-type tricarboxylate transporter receptor subunit TctC